MLLKATSTIILMLPLDTDNFHLLSYLNKKLQQWLHGQKRCAHPGPNHHTYTDFSCGLVMRNENLSHYIFLVTISQGNIVISMQKQHHSPITACSHLVVTRVLGDPLTNGQQLFSQYTMALASQVITRD